MKVGTTKKNQIIPKPEKRKEKKGKGRKEKKRKEKHQTDRLSVIKQAKAAEDVQGMGELQKVSRNIIRAGTVEMTMETPQSTKGQSVHICNPSTQEARQEDVRLSSVMAT